MTDVEQYKNIPHGDMPGDKIEIHGEHVEKAKTIYPVLKEMLAEKLRNGEKCVVSVCGGSGVGKSEIGSLLAYFLSEDGIPTYLMSGDNYPHRIPLYNDEEREAVYRQGGKAALERYLGSEQEINFREVNHILAHFKQGDASVWMKRMGRKQGEVHYDEILVADTQVLILEWTHGNSDNIDGVDFPILLNSTPEETLEHRRSRNRDGAVDSPFVTMVLEIEQKKLMQQAKKAKIIISKQGELLSYDDYCKCMEVEK